jgi:hypothetical protein
MTIATKRNPETEALKILHRIHRHRSLPTSIKKRIEILIVREGERRHPDFVEPEGFRKGTEKVVDEIEDLVRGRNQ